MRLEKKAVQPKQSLMDFLRGASERPRMYIGEYSARQLCSIIQGWVLCLDTVGLEDPLFREFQVWLDKVKYGASGPTHALNLKIEELGDEKALDWFFQCFDEYVRDNSDLFTID